MSTAGTTVQSILLDAFGRVADGVQRLLDGMPPAVLDERPADSANPVGWLIWHLTRVQDDHLCEIAGRPQVWTADGFYERFGLPHPVDDTGYGHDSDQVAATIVTDVALLAEYHHGVSQMTTQLIGDLDPARLDAVIDERFDPPVTVAVRIVSVIEDCLQHLGQANYVAGLVERSVSG